MTNGEKIKEIFPDCFIVKRLSDNKIVHLVCTEEFLNSEYKEPTTKNDAISRADVLKLMQDNWHTHNGDWAMQESMDDIRTLPSVTTQLCEDTVSRQALINWLKHWTLGDATPLIDFVNSMPAVISQKPKIGHWELVQRGKNIDICCSNCEEVRIKSYAYNYTIDQLTKEDLKECFECADMRYCPSCGADMREVNNGNN